MAGRNWQSITIADVLRIPCERGGSVSGVYALFVGDRLVYIGHAEDLRARLIKHYRRFKFSRVKCAVVNTKPDRQVLERRLLFKLKPSDNRVIPGKLRPNAFSMSYQPLRPSHGGVNGHC